MSPFPEGELREHDDWKVTNGWPLTLACLASDSAGRQQNILKLIRKQFPGLVVMDEKVPFELPEAAAAFASATAEPLPASSAAAATTPLKMRPAETYDVDEAGPVPLQDASAPPPT